MGSRRGISQGTSWDACYRAKLLCRFAVSRTHAEMIDDDPRWFDRPSTTLFEAVANEAVARWNSATAAAKPRDRADLYQIFIYANRRSALSQMKRTPRAVLSTFITRVSSLLANIFSHFPLFSLLPPLLHLLPAEECNDDTRVIVGPLISGSNRNRNRARSAIVLYYSGMRFLSPVSFYV